MRLPTPVMNRAIITDSGSSCREKLTCSPATGTHAQIDLMTWRWSAERPSKAKKVHDRAHEGGRGAQRRQVAGLRFPQLAAEGQQDQEPGQGQGDDEVGGVHDRLPLSP